MLLDTCILIDILRKDPQAEKWLRGLARDAPLAIPGIAYMELVRGELIYENSKEGVLEGGTRVSNSGITQNKQGLSLIRRQFNGFPVYWPSEAAQEKAFTKMRNLYPAYPIPIPDFLIAFTAIEKDLPLVSLDTDFDHFEDDGLKILRPYRGKLQSGSRREKALA